MLNLLDETQTQDAHDARTKQVPADTNVGTAKTSYIYVIRGSNFFKVGCAQNVETRLRSLQTASPHALAVVHTERVPATELLRVELGAHALLRHLRVSGEWFNAPLPVIQEAIQISIAAALASPSIPDTYDKQKTKDAIRMARLIVNFNKKSPALK